MIWAGHGMLLHAARWHPLKGHGVVRLQAGIHIVTPNKKLNSGPLPQYQALRQFQRGSYIHFFYEARTSIIYESGCQCVHAGGQSVSG